MPVQYSTTHINATGVCATKNDILNLLETQLVLAGWTVVSGSGTTNRLFQTGTTVQGLALRCRAKDNGGTCVQISIESTDGTLTSTNSTNAGGNLNPTGGPTFRIIANPFQFIIYSPANYANNRLCVFVCCPYIPTPNAVPTRAGFMISDSQQDTNTSLRECWRTTLVSATNSNGPGNCAVLWGGTLWQINNGFSGNWQGYPALVLLISIAGSGGVNGANVNCRRWQSGADITSDTLIAFAPAPDSSGEPFICCQLWDTLVVHNNFAGDTTGTWDGHNWITPTNNNTGNQVTVNGALPPRGSLFFATS